MLPSGVDWLNRPDVSYTTISIYSLVCSIQYLLTDCHILSALHTAIQAK